MTGLARLTKASFREQALREIRAAIVTGETKSGTVLSARSLAAQLGVSVTPVREALLELANAGLVEALPNRGFRVTAPTEIDLDEIFELRMLLEVPAVAALAGRLSKDIADELVGFVDWGLRAAKAGDLAEFLESDRRFHLRVLEAHGNGRLVDLVDQLRAQTRLYGLPHLMQAGALAASAREHAELLQAILCGDRRAAESVMRRHLRHTRGIWAGMQEASARTVAAVRGRSG